MTEPNSIVIDSSEDEVKSSHSAASQETIWNPYQHTAAGRGAATATAAPPQAVAVAAPAASRALLPIGARDSARPNMPPTTTRTV